MMYKKSKAFEIEICCGEERGCSHKLGNVTDIAAELSDMLNTINWEARIKEKIKGKLPRRLKLRIALASCPNACSRPQIKDIGLVMVKRPVKINNNCNSCGQCEKSCRENAIKTNRDIAIFYPDKCVGCGDCIDVCLKNAIEVSQLKIRMFTAGRLGRHPRLGDNHKDSIAISEVTETIKKILIQYLDSCDITHTTFSEFAIAEFCDKNGSSLELVGEKNSISNIQQGRWSSDPKPDRMVGSEASISNNEGKTKKQKEIVRGQGT